MIALIGSRFVKYLNLGLEIRETMWWVVQFTYLVRDINTPIFFTKPRIFFNKIWCYDYFNDAVKCILKPHQDLGKFWMISIQKKQKSKWKFVNWWISELMSLTRCTFRGCASVNEILSKSKVMSAVRFFVGFKELS